MKPFLYLIAVLLVWNLIAFLIMGLDKRKAVKDKRRISEKTLLGCGFLMGAAGVGAGMLVFHHKTLKWKFRILVPLALVLNLAILGGIFYLMICLQTN